MAGPPLPADSARARLPLVRAGPWLPPSAAARRRPGIVLAPVHALDHRVLAAQHPCPYPGSAHAVPFPHVPVCRISDTTDGDGVPRPASAPPGSRSGLAFIAARPRLGAAVVQAGRRPPRRGRRAWTADAPSRTIPGWKQAPIVPAADATSPAAVPASPPARATPTTQRIPAADPGQATHGTGRGASFVQLLVICGGAALPGLGRGRPLARACRDAAAG